MAPIAFDPRGSGQIKVPSPHAVRAGAALAAYLLMMPAGAPAGDHIAPLRELASDETALSIAGDGGMLALGSGGKALFTGAVPASVGAITATITTSKGLQRPIVVMVEPALAPLVYHVTPTGTGNGSLATPAPFFSIPSLCAAANAAGRPADIRVRADLGTYARGTGNALAIALGGTSEFTRICIRGVDADGNPAKAVITGARPAPPTNNQSASAVFNLVGNASFIRFSDLDVRNVGVLCKHKGGVGSGFVHREIEYRDVEAYNVYRLVVGANDDDYDNPWGTSTEGLRMWRINVDYAGHSALLIYASVRLDLQDITVDYRGENHPGDYPGGITTAPSSMPDGKPVIDACSRIYARNIVVKGAVDVQDSEAFAQGDGWNLDSGGASVPGGMVRIESDGTTIADYVIIDGLTGLGNGDSVIDCKASGAVIRNLYGVNTKRTGRNWGDRNSYPDMVSINPCNQPGAANDGRCHLMVIGANSHVTVDRPRWYSRKLGLINPVDGLPILGTDASQNIIVADGRTGQVIELNDWRGINTDPDIPLIRKEGRPALPGGYTASGATIIATPPLPTITSSISWAFAAGNVDQGTAVGTVLGAPTASIVSSDVAMVAEHTILSDPDAKVEMVGGQIRLRAALDLATKAAHSFTVRSVIGIVGSGDPADNLTWYGYGLAYADRTHTLIVTA